MFKSCEFLIDYSTLSTSTPNKMLEVPGLQDGNALKYGGMPC